MDFSDLEDDTVIKDKLINFRKSITKIENIVNTLTTSNIYDNLPVKEKVDYDLFMAYTLNTLYWLYLRSRNEDPNKNEIKNQLARVKDYMVKAKEAHVRTTIRPTIDKPAAARFVKHGINYRKEIKEGPSSSKKPKHV